MAGAFSSFPQFILRVMPGVAVAGISLLVLPKKLVELRLILYILIFVLFRDTMTPLGFWEIRPDLVVRFANDPALLVSLGLLSAAFVVFMELSEPEFKGLRVWLKGPLPAAIAWGLAGALAVAAPAWLYYRSTPGFSAPPVPPSILPALLTLMILGNFLEEVLFRGYLQGYLERKVSATRAAILSGLFFAAFHAFLATSVTSLGIPLLAFTLYEGLICAFLQKKRGLVAPILAHGLGIFLLASGLLFR